MSFATKVIGPVNGLAADLARRLEAKGRPIRIGLIGCGEMGTDIVTQCDQMTGITVAAIAELHIDAAQKALGIAGRPADSFAVADSKTAFDACLKAGKTAITGDAQAICSSDEIDVIIDATGRPAVGAAIGLTAMEHGMPNAAWRVLTLRWGVFFLVVAGLNELIWRNVSTDTWVNFKVFGLLGLTLVFALANAPFMAKHMIEDEASKPDVPPA